MTTRREFTLAGSALVSCGILGLTRPAFAGTGFATLDNTLATIERNSGGRLGVCVFDTGSGTRATLHPEDLFPMCSTFKLLACAAVLKRVEDGKEDLGRRVTFQDSDIVPDSTVIKDMSNGNSRTMAELCEAAMTWSDNTSGNLILNTLGGPTGLTAYARSLGDAVTRLDRNEPALNEAIPGDPRDTTTPAAMLNNLNSLLFGSALNETSRKQLTQWLIDNKTGGKRLRSELPQDWRCGDKTGSGERGTTNDVGVLWPPQGKPVLVTIYLTGTAAAADQRNATLAAVGRAIATAYAA